MMIKKLLLPTFLILISNFAYADSSSYGAVIQHQSQKIRQLQNQVQNLEYNLKEIRIVLLNAGLIDNAIIIQKDTVSLDSDSIDTNQVNNIKQLPRDQNDKIEYDIALASLKDENFKLAEEKFANFITTYPDSNLQSNATFWYAETLFRQRIFNKAAINYLQSYKKYPKGIKAPDALLKLAYSLSNLEKNDEACKVLEKLDSEFPERSNISKTRTKEALVKFYCK